MEFELLQDKFVTHVPFDLKAAIDGPLCEDVYFTFKKGYQKFDTTGDEHAVHVVTQVVRWLRDKGFKQFRPGKNGDAQVHVYAIRHSKFGKDVANVLLFGARVDLHLQ